MSNNKSSNTQQAFWVAIGSFFSFGFGIISSMILSRYFNKEDYGTYKQVLYVYNTMLTVFSLGLPKSFSYFLPRVKIEEAKSLIKKLTSLFFLLGAVFSLLLFFGSNFIANVLKNPDLAFALKIFSPVPFLLLPTMGLEGILATYKLTKFTAIYTILTRIGMLIFVSVPVIFFNGGYIQAIIGFVIASFISFCLALYFKFYPVKNSENKPTSLKYKQIFAFSMPLMVASLWGILLKSTDQFFLSRYFGTEAFAEFSNGFMDLPFIGMIVGATATVLSPVFARLSHEKMDPQKEIYPLFKNAFEKTAMLIYPILIFTIIFADVFMITIYGQKYENSAVYYIIYNVANFFDIIVFAPLIINIGKVKFYQRVHMFSALLLIPLEFTSVLIIDSPYAIAIISVLLKIIRAFVFLHFISRFFHVKLYQMFPLKIIIKIVLFSVSFLMIERILFSEFIEISNLETLCYSFLLFLFGYAIYARIMNLNYNRILKPLLKKIKVIE